MQQVTDRGIPGEESAPGTVVSALNLPEHISLDALLQEVSYVHGKPVTVKIVEEAIFHGVSGLWVESSQRSILLVRDGLSELHRMHVILHECGHILLRHRGCDGLLESMPSLFQHIGRKKGIKTLLARSPRWNELEIAAEHVAYLLSGYVLDNPSRPISEFEKVFE